MGCRSREKRKNLGGDHKEVPYEEQFGGYKAKVRENIKWWEMLLFTIYAKKENHFETYRGVMAIYCAENVHGQSEKAETCS